MMRKCQRPITLQTFPLGILNSPIIFIFILIIHKLKRRQLKPINPPAPLHSLNDIRLRSRMINTSNTIPNLLPDIIFHDSNKTKQIPFLPIVHIIGLGSMRSSDSAFG